MLSRKMIALFVTTISVLSLASTFSAAASAAAITWGPATTISGDSNVSTNGTLVYAYDWNGTAAAPAGGTTTVNGVSFVGLSTSDGSGTGGNLTMTGWVGPAAPNSNGSINNPYAALSTQYKGILGCIIFVNNGVGTVTLNNLTNGTQYELEVWTNISSSAGSTANTFTATNSVSLDANTSNVNGGVGQFAIGTFTASGTSQLFTVSNADNFPHFNALQLRDLTAAPAVPEPSTFVLAALGLAGLGLVAWRRRNRNAE